VKDLSVRTPEKRFGPRTSTDPELDALLGRIEPTFLASGFADRVIQSVQPAGAASGTSTASGMKPAGRFRALWIAASVMCCFGLVWWSVSPSNTRPRPASSTASAAPSEEEVLLKALTTLEINSGDLSLVAQLGDVLEAELTERTSWLEKEQQ
jgi:hypothetical protein